MVLTETFKIYDPEMYNLHGYKKFYNKGNSNINDGVFVHVREFINLEYELVKIGYVSAIKLLLCLLNIDFIALYKSPSQDVNDFIQNLEHWCLKSVFRNHTAIIIVENSTKATNSFL